MFGSCAPGEAYGDSDLDVLIVFGQFKNYSKEMRRRSQSNSEVSPNCGRRISCVFAREGKWQYDETMLFCQCPGEDDPSMKEDAREILDNAGRALRAAEAFGRTGDTEIAGGRAYCAMLHTA